MNKFPLFLCAVSAVTASLVTHALNGRDTGVCAGEYIVDTVKDRHGIKRGTIEQRPNGEVVIKDRYGIKRGTIETKRDGRTIVKDRWGIPQREIK